MVTHEDRRMKIIDAPPSVAAELSVGLDPRHVLATLMIEDGSGSLAAVRDPFDSANLGLAIARVTTAKASSTAEFSALHEAVAKRLLAFGVDQVLRRVDLDPFEELWALEANGYRLMDAGLVFERRLQGSIDSPDSGDVLVRLSTDEDLSRIAPVMVQQPWGARYEADPAYRAEDVRELRLQWLWNSHRGRAAAMFVGVVDDAPAGYVTCRLHPAEAQGEIELVGTLPGFRGRGVALRILNHALAWFSTRAAVVTVRTQATNYCAANLYTRAGFLLARTDASFRLALSRRGESFL
jgi:GNAT superfamily N-acetyltransferase